MGPGAEQCRELLGASESSPVFIESSMLMPVIIMIIVVVVTTSTVTVVATPGHPAAALPVGRGHSQHYLNN